jgi:hypothetical protein
LHCVIIAMIIITQLSSTNLLFLYCNNNEAM